MSSFAKVKEYLGDKEFCGNVVRIALPITAQSLITVGVNMMGISNASSIITGQTLGEGRIERPERMAMRFCS